MIFYSIILILSLGGIAVIVRRNRDEFIAFNFAEFMEKITEELADVWRSNLRERTFNFIEKRMMNLRIFFLKTENHLLKAIHHVRGIKEKNGNGSTQIPE